MPCADRMARRAIAPFQRFFDDNGAPASTANARSGCTSTTPGGGPDASTSRIFAPSAKDCAEREGSTARAAA